MTLPRYLFYFGTFHYFAAKFDSLASLLSRVGLTSRRVVTFKCLICFLARRGTVFLSNLTMREKYFSVANDNIL